MFLFFFFRQSIDMYSGLSPATGFLGTPTLSRLSSSFFSSFRVKHTPEKTASLIKPLLLTTTADEQPQEERQSSDSLLTPLLPSRKPSLEKIQEKVFHELPSSRNSSYGQAVFNGVYISISSFTTMFKLFLFLRIHYLFYISLLHGNIG